MKTTSIFILGILFGMGISVFGNNYLNGNKYAILNQDYELANGGILKKGTKIKNIGSFPEGFEQYILYLNMPRWVYNELTMEQEKSPIIPHWIEPVYDSKDKKVKCDTIFEFGEELPKFKGGGSELLKYNLDMIVPLVRESNKEAGKLITKLFYSLVISKEGEVVETEVLTEVEIELKNKLEKELRNMPNWIPGKVNGENVCMRIKIPISCIKWE
jgi:hypothetical protein